MTSSPPSRGGRPRSTTSDLGTLSTMIALPGSLWRRIPHAPVFASMTETALVSSVISAHVRGARADRRRDADEEAARRDDRVVGPDAVVPADADDDTLVELLRRLREDRASAGRCSPSERSGRPGSGASASGRAFSWRTASKFETCARELLVLLASASCSRPWSSRGRRTSRPRRGTAVRPGSQPSRRA